MPLFGSKTITLEVYGDKRHGQVETPTFAKVKDLRERIAASMDEDHEENLELTIKGRPLPLEKTLEDVGLLDGSRIDVNMLTKEEKSNRVHYQNSNRRKGEYSQLAPWSDDSCEDTSDGGGIRIDRVRQLLEATNMKLREKLKSKFKSEVSVIDFILQALKMHQRDIHYKTIRMSTLYAISLLILVFGYVFFWYMYETEADINQLTLRLEEAVTSVSDLNPADITLYPDTPIITYNGLGDWAKAIWPARPPGKYFVGEITYEAMLVHFERFKLGYQPVIILKDGETRISRLYLYLCRVNKELVDLYCFLGTMFASLELWCNVDADLCILTGPYDIITGS